MKRIVRHSLATVAAIGVLVSGGCSGGGGGGGGGGGPTGPSGTVEVHATSSNRFSPATVTIARGTKVQWVADNTAGHTVTPDNPTQAGVFASADIGTAGAQFEYTFNTAGDFNYHCAVHAGMTGVVRVQ
jgi:plastocyanin